MKISTRRLRRRVGRMLLSDEERTRRALLKLYDTLAQTAFHNKYWLCGGLLIGYLRDGRSATSDLDVDFNFWDTDRAHLVDGITALIGSGFRKLHRWVNNTGQVTEWCLEYGGVKFDFFENHRHEDRIRWYSYIVNPRRQMLNEVPFHGLAPFQLLDRRWLKPDDHDTFLSSIYGDWRMPCSDYCFWIDSKAIVSRIPWRGDSTW